MTRNELKEIIKEYIEERNYILEYKELYWDQFDRKDKSKIIDLATKASKIVYNKYIIIGRKILIKRNFLQWLRKHQKDIK